MLEEYSGFIIVGSSNAVCEQNDWIKKHTCFNVLEMSLSDLLTHSV